MLLAGSIPNYVNKPPHAVYGAPERPFVKREKAKYRRLQNGTWRLGHNGWKRVDAQPV